MKGMMKTKSLKVYQGAGKNYVSIPKIILQGKWLDGLGFSIGDKITVTCREDKITIMKAADPQEDRCTESEGNAGMEPESCICTV